MELIRSGTVGPEVEDVQRRLEDLGFPCADDPGVFSEATEAAVRAFQQRRGLPSDGIVGDDTWRALVGASYRLGDRMLYRSRPPQYGDDVQELQRRLNQLGFDAGYDDGVYGDQTFEAVREFQLNVGINVDGIAGPKSVDLLLRLHRRHQEAPAYAVREREQSRGPGRLSVAGASVLLDPGRSPQDPGLIAFDGSPEHELTWHIAALAEGQLAALGARVVLSRGPSTSPTPSQRAAHANAENVEAVLSIHLNGYRSPRACGTVGYFFGTEVAVSDRGRILAELAVGAVSAATDSANCRVHPSTTAILRETRAPAALVEPGFLTHPEEGRALLEPAYQRKIAGALVDALVGFLLGRHASAAA